MGSALVGSPFLLAPWPSGKAEDCKSSIVGSIPTGASAGQRRLPAVAGAGLRREAARSRPPVSGQARPAEALPSLVTLLVRLAASLYPETPGQVRRATARREEAPVCGRSRPRPRAAGRVGVGRPGGFRGGRPTASGLLVLVAACFAAGGCAEPDDEGPAPPAETPALPRVDTMQVLMDEYTISMPLVLPAGPHPVRFVNAGFEEHNIYFRRKEDTAEDAAPAWVLERRLNPGERRVVTVELEPGAYTAICDFSGHDGRGMFTDFTVAPAADSPGQPPGQPDSVAPAS